MSRENVEVSRRMWDRFLARDIPGTIAFLDPEVEIHDMPQVPDARVYHGHTGWQTQIERFSEAFTNLSYRLLECIDCGENVVSVIHASGTGAGSGIPAEVTYAQVETWRDEKVVSMRYFMSKEEALETVGLREQLMSRENVEIVKRAHAALARGDTGAFIREMDEDIEGMSRVMDAEGVTYSGHDGMRHFVDDLLSVFPDFRSEVVRAVEGNDAVVAELCFGGSATRSRLAVEGRTWQALTFRGGKILSFRAYETEAEALEAVGLREQAMSRENVEIVEALFQAWDRGDRDGWLAPAHPEVEWSSAILRQVEGAETVSRGRTELGRFWDEWHALWSVDIEVSEMRDLGDTVLALARFRTRGVASGVEVERSIGYVLQFEDGLLRRARAYLSPEEALEAVGLSE